MHCDVGSRVVSETAAAMIPRGMSEVDTEMFVRIAIAADIITLKAYKALATFAYGRNSDGEVQLVENYMSCLLTAPS